MNDDPLSELRTQIDNVDDQILELLAQRTELVEQIKEIKRLNKIDTLQASRFQEMLDRLQEQARAAGVDPKLVHDIWHAIHENSLRQQNQ